MYTKGIWASSGFWNFASAVLSGASRATGSCRNRSSATRERCRNMDGWFRRTVLSGKAISPNQSIRQGVWPFGRAEIRGNSLFLLRLVAASRESGTATFLTYFYTLTLAMGSVADADCILAGTVQRIGPDKDHPATKGCWAFNEEGCL